MKEDPFGSPASEAPRPRRVVDPVRAQWRRDLLAARETLSNREDREAQLVQRVERWLATVQVDRLGFFWPIRGEPDLAALVGRWLRQGPARIAALPVIEGAILRFAPWTPGAVLARGAFDVLVPDTPARIDPQLLLIPCVGIDRLRYRLGYGGGYYDRTLAELSPRPMTVGIGFDCARIESIDPKPHDLCLDFAMTEAGTW